MTHMKHLLTLRSLLAALITIVTSGAFSSPASADDQVSSLLFTCNLSFKATGKSIYVGVGYTDVEGSGTISCYDLLTGATQHLPVKVKARGPGAGLGVTGLVLSGAATGVGVTKGPENLLGRYGMIRGNAAVGVGAAGGVALRLSNGSVTVDVSLEAQSGLGAGVDLLWIDIESDGAIRTEAAKIATPPVIAAPAAQQQPIRVSAPKTIYLP
ncbi:MAG: hypothetical protein IPJ84_19465 [Bdellovibrionales bacterium]|nr:hypothetical protein [Bdellovibrionales bacterium]